ncbi:SRPBCC family protein [Pseudochryseolinea flava]|uniref:SRPBCC domain-containing protein n=1 Tax=Pseudochryseolinea flava TaxID=2059302 RepID=A0A364Y5M1_9BACT|nr:SRPBCC domain-containing protein [Pseudochryseolinea flava]RAW02296.1 SRPBCC domain-containing protein [Pseudochryseolinea flava]
MKKDYQTVLTVDVTPAEAYDGIRNVTKWWTKRLEGNSHALNDEFTVRFFDDVHVSTQRIVELVPNKKVVWLVTHSKLNFVDKENEWNNTKVVFEIERVRDKTKVKITHEGLNSSVACFEDCSAGWNHYLGGSLNALLTTGVGKPETK